MSVAEKIQKVGRILKAIHKMADEPHPCVRMPLLGKDYRCICLDRNCVRDIAGRKKDFMAEVSKILVAEALDLDVIARTMESYWTIGGGHTIVVEDGVIRVNGCCSSMDRLIQAIWETLLEGHLEQEDVKMAWGLLQDARF
jgi:hypothetical protein